MKHSYLLFIIPILVSAQVDYNSSIQPVFDERCATAYCHGTGSGGLYLTSYAQLMAGTSNHGPVVIPGDGEGSILVQKLRGTAGFGGLMPPSGSLSDDTINLISLWIDEGATEEPSVSIGDDQDFPTALTLHQNFPNPFNPTTTLLFNIETSTSQENTSLQIIDINGRLVKTFISEYLNPGKYQIQWDAGHFPTGIYFAQLSSGGKIQVIKMVYLK
jgi:hypothetical protein